MVEVVELIGDCSCRLGAVATTEVDAVATTEVGLG